MTSVNVLYDLPVDLSLYVENVEEDPVPGQESGEGERCETLQKT